MFGFKFIKFEPSLYIFLYKNGKIIKEGAGLSFFYYSPTSSIIAVPMGSADVPFIFNEVTSDFQELSVQGQIAYKISSPKQISEILNYTLSSSGKQYMSDDPQKLDQRVINLIQVIVKGELQKYQLHTALKSTEELVSKIKDVLSQSNELNSLGIKILGLSILAIKPNPETARALEAETREELLKNADEATYTRRNSAVEQERKIKENELNTEIAIETKKRQIRETQMEADRALQEKKYLILEDEVNAKTTLEKKNIELLNLSVKNSKLEADAKAYSIKVQMEAFKDVDSRIVHALSSVGMNSTELMAKAFTGLAESAGKIGELNISPDLLREIMKEKHTVEGFNE